MQEILAKVEELPPLPGVAQQILTMVQDPEFSFQALMETVRLDPGITANVLKMANSAFFGLRRRVASLDQALQFLGTNNLLEIVLSSQLMRFYADGQAGYQLSRGELWHHSMAVALLAQRLGEQLRFPQKPTLFTAALLHDVGKLVLSEFVSQDFALIEELVRNEGISFVEAERQVLGLDHAVLGGVVARHWNFPEDIVNGIAFHHHAERTTRHRELTAMVALANLVVIMWGGAAGAEGLSARVPEGLLRIVGLKTRDLDLLGLEVKDILDQADDLLNLGR